MISKVIVNFSIILSVTTALAGGPPQISKSSRTQGPNALTQLQTVLNDYNKNQGLESRVEKKVYLSLLEETRTSRGRLYYSQKKMRLELSGEEKSVIVMLPDVIWVEVSDTSGSLKPQVSKITAKSLKQQSRSPIALLFARNSILKEFNLKSETQEGAVYKVSLQPQRPQNFLDLQSLYVEFDSEKKVLLLIQYEDENANRTTFQFSDIEKNKSLDKKVFQYKPPTNADVSVYN